MDGQTNENNKTYLEMLKVGRKGERKEGEREDAKSIHRLAMWKDKKRHKIIANLYSKLTKESRTILPC